jgi:virginiamycin B lyase
VRSHFGGTPPGSSTSSGSGDRPRHRFSITLILVVAFTVGTMGLAPAGSAVASRSDLPPRPSVARDGTVGQIFDFTAPSINNPYGIAAGSDGALWFTNNGNDSIGRISTTGAVSNFTSPAINSPTSIVSGPDGALWFTNIGNNSIGRITTSGIVSSFTAPTVNGPTTITVGSDGALWFINYNTQTFGRITTSGLITRFPGLGSGLPQVLTSGPDGALWFTVGASNDSVGRISTGGSLSDHTGPGVASPQGIAPGPDGALWFNNTGFGGSIGRITTSGALSTYAAPYGWRITPGPDGAMWYTSGTSITRLALDGTTTSYSDATVKAALYGIVAGPDGAVWFTNSGNNSIGRIVAVLPGIRCTATISGNHVGTIVVGPGSTCVSGAHITGSLIVPRGAAVDIESSSIVGPISATAPSGLRICATAVSGSVTVGSATGFVLVGDSGDDGCASNTIGGSLILVRNTHGVDAIGNHVAGAVSATANAGAGPFSEDIAPEISGNSR